MKKIPFGRVHEYACDACPVKCRLEVTSSEFPVDAPTKCPTHDVPGALPHWVDQGARKGEGSVKVTNPGGPVRHISAVPALVACTGCTHPCLLEVTGSTVLQQCVCYVRSPWWVNVCKES